MAQVRKLSGGEKVPVKKNGNINYNGTTSEFTDDIYTSLVANLDTGAASGIIRKGLDIGKQEGNTFYYDSEYNRAFVLNSEGKKIWDYQSTIGPRKNIKVQWQGTFGRENLAKNPNDVNRLLQAIMSGFSIPSPEDPEEPVAPTKKKISTSNITIGIGKDKTVSTYDANYTSALNRLALLDEYYNNADTFTSEYDFDESNLWRNYLDTHKGNIYVPGEGETPGKSKFAEILERVANGTYSDDDEKLLNAFNIFLSTESAKSTGSGSGIETRSGSGFVSGSGSGSGSGSSSSSGFVSGNREENNNSEFQDDNQDEDLVSMRFSEYYLPQFYDATVTKSHLGPTNQDWIGAKTWKDKSGNDYIEFTTKDGKRYYVYTNPEKNSYLRIPNSNNIYWDENSFWDFIEKNGWTPDPTDTWTELEWMPNTELKRTTQDGPINVIGWENLKVGTHKVPIRKSLSENPMYYAKLLSGHWIPLTLEEYDQLKNGNMKVLHNKVPTQFYKDGGKILKMQTAPGGQIPVTDMTATYDASIYKDPSMQPISGWDKTAIIGTGIGTGSHIIGALSTNPKVKRIANIASLLGYGTATVGNTVSDYQNTGKVNWGNLALSTYGIARGIMPRPKQRYFYNNNIPVNASASRGTRMWKGVQNYAPRVGQIFDIGTGLTGTTFGTIGTVNLISSIANDPNKTWNWNTWTMGDARNFQMGMTGLSPLVAGTASMVQNAKMRKYLPQTTSKLGSLDEINFALKPGTQFGLKRNAVNYIKTNPIKEAYFGSPYIRTINTSKWNNPATKWGASTFTISPSAIGLTGGLMPWDIYSTPKEYIFDKPFTPQGPVVPIQGTIQPADTVRFNGGLMFKKGGILKMQTAPGGNIPRFNFEKKSSFDPNSWKYDPIKSAYELSLSLGPEGGFMSDVYKLRQRQLWYPEEFKTEDASSTLDPQDYIDDGDGRWAKALNMTGSIIVPMLELGKFHQAIRTASQNGEDEREALWKAVNLRQKSAKPLMQFSSDFSKYDNALTTGLGQLNSSFGQFANSTSDNNQVLSGFNSYASNLSKLIGNYIQSVAEQSATDRKQNLALYKDWSDSEYARVNENNALVAEGILGEAKSLDAERQAKSGHINTLFNTFQDWITKDKATGSNLNELLTLRESIVKHSILTGENVTNQLADLDKRIAEARQNSKILPSFRKV